MEQQAKGGGHHHVQRHHLSPDQKQNRKEQVLTKKAPATARSIADAIVAKDEDLCFICERDGSVPLGGDHGLGLYYHDCRYLNGYEMHLNGVKPDPLVATANRGFMSVFELTNNDFEMANGHVLPKRRIGLTWERIIDAKKSSLQDLITLRNYEGEDVEFPMSFHFQSGFEDIFNVRGMLPNKLGKMRPPAWKDGSLQLAYEGADKIHRSLSIHFSETPIKKDENSAHFKIRMKGGECIQLLVTLAIAESESEHEVQPKTEDRPAIQRIEALKQQSSAHWLGKHAQVDSNSPLLDSLIERSICDLRVLRSQLDGREYFAAGVPWFITLFGRDSMITAMQMLAFESGIAENTLRLLAGRQGTKVDDWRDEQPGKILHEFRMGEMAHLNEVPYSPYYGSIDGTILFLIVLARHAAWTGELTLFHDLRDNVERALNWIDHYGDLDGDGYVEYASQSGKGLINQGWKDSGDAIVNADGSLATPPIALVEVQGYIHMAKRLIAELYERAGAPERADALRQQADTLRERFNKDFWIDDMGCYALALQGRDKTPCKVISSNPGQALWSGIADPDKAKKVAKRLMEEDMFNGWGIRTLSAREKAYIPIAYHLGTVWPHDNAFIATGFRRYGFDDAALKVFEGILDAATHFHSYRLPELFAGFGRRDYTVPVSYPVADHPQAWAAGATPYMLTTLLGLVPEGFNNQLRIVKPILPRFIHHLDLKGVRVGSGSADLRFERDADGDLVVKVLKTTGNLDIIEEPGTSPARMAL